MDRTTSKVNRELFSLYTESGQSLLSGRLNELRLSTLRNAEALRCDERPISQETSRQLDAMQVAETYLSLQEARTTIGELEAKDQARETELNDMAEAVSNLAKALKGVKVTLGEEDEWDANMSDIRVIKEAALAMISINGSYKTVGVNYTASVDQHAITKRALEEITAERDALRSQLQTSNQTVDHLVDFAEIAKKRLGWDGHSPREVVQAGGSLGTVKDMARRFATAIDEYEKHANGVIEDSETSARDAEEALDGLKSCNKVIDRLLELLAQSNERVRGLRRHLEEEGKWVVYWRRRFFKQPAKIPTPPSTPSAT